MPAIAAGRATTGADNRHNSEVTAVTGFIPSLPITRGD